MKMKARMQVELARGTGDCWLGRWEWRLKEPGTRAARHDRLHAALQRAGMAAAPRSKALAVHAQRVLMSARKDRDTSPQACLEPLGDAW